MSTTLLLWDIDGTLIDSGAAGEKALSLALEREFQLKDDIAWLDFFGRTDLWIVRSILRQHKLGDTALNVERYLTAYLKALSELIDNPHGRVLPGIRKIIDRVARRTDVVQGLLTGNVEPGARIKLGHLGISDYFPFGAFAGDSENRNELGPFALRRAATHHQRDFGADRVFVIGDTPHDIACGRAIGA